MEKSLHWVQDVTFNEDASRVRKDKAPENVAMLRHVALNLLKKADPLKKTRLRVKRKKASWSPDSLCHVLGLPNEYRPRLPSKGPRTAPRG